MVSRRSFLAITIIMVIICVMFQYVQVVRSSENDYFDNPYSDLKLPERHEWQPIDYKEAERTGIIPWEDGGYVLFIGDDTSPIGSVVSQWASYSKRQMYARKSLEGFTVAKFKSPEFIILDSNYINFDKDLSRLYELTDKGISIVFCNLPSVEVLEANDSLKDFMGINYIKEPSVTVEGMKLFGGFLLGGETIYEPEKKEDERRQDLDLEVPWIVTGGGTKTYMVGIMDDYYKKYAFKNEYFPAIIWRNSLGNAQVFCVCGDYMNTTGGIGILSAMIYELSDYSIYPVVNAQNTLLVDFPLMADENREEFTKIYSRTALSFQNDVIWPTLISLDEKYKLKYTCFMSPKYNYQDPAEPGYDFYEFYLKNFNERGSELGISLEHDDNVELADKLYYDTGYYDTIAKRYVCSSAFLNINDIDKLEEAVQNPHVKHVKTIACAEDINTPILSYINDDITLQCLTSSAKNLTYKRDLMLKSVETALAYDNAEMNFSDVYWPSGDGDHWENIYNDMSSSLATYWRPFRVFARTSLTESDQRVRVFLNLGCEYSREQNCISLKVSGRDGNTGYFMLRTHGEEIVSMSKGSFEKIEDDAFLITLDDDETEIYLKPTDTLGD